MWPEATSEAEDAELLNNQSENGTAFLMRPKSLQAVCSERSSMVADVETDIWQPLDIESGTTMLRSNLARPRGKLLNTTDIIEPAPQATYNSLKYIPKTS